MYTQTLCIVHKHTLDRPESQNKKRKVYFYFILFVSFGNTKIIKKKKIQKQTFSSTVCIYISTYYNNTQRKTLYTNENN